MINQYSDSVKINDVKDILLTDFQITRAQIRASEDWHERISLVFTLTAIASVLGVMFVDPTKLIVSKSVLFSLINLIVMSQLAFLLNYHFFYLDLWANYVALVESKLQALCSECNIIEFETVFAPVYFFQMREEARRITEKTPIQQITDFLHKDVNRILVLLIHLPSLAVYCYSTYGFAAEFPIWWQKTLSYILFALPLLFLGFLFVTMKSTTRHKDLVHTRERAAAKFREWLSRKQARDAQYNSPRPT